MISHRVAIASCRHSTAIFPSLSSFMHGTRAYFVRLKCYMHSWKFKMDFQKRKIDFQYSSMASRYRMMFPFSLALIYRRLRAVENWKLSATKYGGRLCTIQIRLEYVWHKCFDISNNALCDIAFAFVWSNINAFWKGLSENWLNR